MSVTLVFSVSRRPVVSSHPPQRILLTVGTRQYCMTINIWCVSVCSRSCTSCWEVLSFVTVTTFCIVISSHRICSSTRSSTRCTLLCILANVCIDRATDWKLSCLTLPIVNVNTLPILCHFFLRMRRKIVDNVEAWDFKAVGLVLFHVGLL